MFKKFELHVPNIITILGSRVNILGGGCIWPFNELENHHFDIEQYFPMSSKNDEKSGHELDLDFLTISY